MTIPVEAGDILVAGNLLALHADAVLEHLHRGLAGLRQVPDPRRAVAGAAGEQVLLGVPGADENLTVVALQHCALLWGYLCCSTSMGSIFSDEMQI